ARWSAYFHGPRGLADSKGASTKILKPPMSDECDRVDVVVVITVARGDISWWDLPTCCWDGTSRMQKPKKLDDPSRFHTLGVKILDDLYASNRNTTSAYCKSS
ncbi:hypothetical protein M8C21_015678, partial [Ambrosia artemisiifolia]